MPDAERDRRARLVARRDARVEERGRAPRRVRAPASIAQRACTAPRKQRRDTRRSSTANVKRLPEILVGGSAARLRAGTAPPRSSAAVRAARSSAGSPSNADRRRVADLAERRDRVVLQRTVELGDLGDLGERVVAAVIAERFDHRAAEKVVAAHHQRHERGPRARIAALRRNRARQRRPHELRPFLVEAPRSAPAASPDPAMMLEPGETHRAQPIVAVAPELAHDARPRSGRRIPASSVSAR